MNSHELNHVDVSVRRHDLIFVRQEAWQAQIEHPEDVLRNRLVTSWASRGWPLVGRRRYAGEPPGIAAGLPMPLPAGKRRLQYVLSPDDIALVRPPLTLRAASFAAPPAWYSTLHLLHLLAGDHDVSISVFGSLAWSALTGLEYMSNGSDLDLLIHVDEQADLRALGNALDGIEALAPMRIDGEYVRTDGGAVNWREFYSASETVLLKAMDGVCLISAQSFLSEAARS